MRNSLPELAIEYLPVGDLVKNPRNARLYSDPVIRNYAEIGKVTTVTPPIFVDENNFIILGEEHWHAAKLRGLEKVPVIRVQNLTEAQKSLLRVGHAKLGDLQEWNPVILAEEFRILLDAQNDLNFDIGATGFEIGEIDAILHPEENSDGPEEVPTPDTGPAISKPGDLWQLGPHRLLCGNSLDPASYTVLMGGERARCGFTDPPYNVKIQGHARGKGKQRFSEFGMASGEMSDQAFSSFLEDFLGRQKENCASGSILFVCMDWPHAEPLLAAAGKLGLELKNICVWAKDRAGMGSLYRSQHEFVFVFKSGKAKHRNNIQLGRHGRNRSNIWKYPAVSHFGRPTDHDYLADQHPTVKPAALVADAILDCSAPGDIILDPFVGSGTTIIAAQRVDRVCYAIELDPLYVDLSIRRWQSLTGEHAICVQTGARFPDDT